MQTSSMHSRWLVRWFCARHVEETEAHEPVQAWIARAMRTQAALSAAIGLRVNGADMNQLITDLEELESVQCGTHQDLRVNAAYTIDNTDELTDRINRQINNTIDALLASAEPMTRRAEDKVMA
jgi:hypothetical protein